ncbi:MAG: B12-binding domain-containing radical SAM protein [Nanoarchaeota archaeon]|nr:B12-binding domain-containing radical SAM protein [Nanoarchaeota archaeon]
MVEKYSILPPYSLMQTAAVLREQGHSVKLVDANGFDMDYSDVDMEGFDMLVFRFTPFTLSVDKKAVHLFKKANPNAKTVGLCYALKKLPTLVLEKFEELDIYVHGEYLSAIPGLAKNIHSPEKVNGISYRSRKKIIATPIGIDKFDWDALPIPAYDLLPSLDPYYTNVPHGKPFTIMYTSKGCPYQCNYCTSAKSKVYTRSTESILKEINYLKEKFKINLILFFDETFTIDRQRTIDLCGEMKKLKINWYCNSRSNLLDLELLKIMKKGGCTGISLGMESGSQKILDSANKGTTVAENAKALNDCYKVGIKVHTSFILGLPGETKETFHKTIEFLKKTLPSSMEINIFFPYPGTQFFKLVKNKDKDMNEVMWQIINNEKFIPFSDFSLEELKLMCKKAYSAIYRNPVWFVKNFFLVMRNPKDIPPAFLYFFKTIKEYFIHDQGDARW